jgi:hypothetical protein
MEGNDAGSVPPHDMVCGLVVKGINLIEGFLCRKAASFNACLHQLTLV